MENGKWRRGLRLEVRRSQQSEVRSQNESKLLVAGYWLLVATSLTRSSVHVSFVGKVASRGEAIVFLSLQNYGVRHFLKSTFLPRLCEHCAP